MWEATCTREELVTKGHQHEPQRGGARRKGGVARTGAATPPAGMWIPNCPFLLACRVRKEVVTMTAARVPLNFSECRSASRASE